MSSDDTTQNSGSAASPDDPVDSTEARPEQTLDTASEPTSGATRASSSDVRSVRRAQREAERAVRAQRKADVARQRAMDAARAGGLFEGMAATPRAEAASETTDTGTTAVPTDTDKTTERTDADSGADVSADAAGPKQSTDKATPTTTGVAPTREPLDPDRRKKLLAALAAASVVLLVITGLATWGYVSARDAGAEEQTVADAPGAATDAARQIATQMFTYDHRTVDADLAAVRERLTDPALSEFVEQSMPAVASSAKQEEASVYATVAAAAPVEVADSGQVTVLVMLNRMVSTNESPEAASSASRLSLQMVEDDGEWKLGELEAL